MWHFSGVFVNRTILAANSLYQHSPERSLVSCCMFPQSPGCPSRTPASPGTQATISTLPRHSCVQRSQSPSLAISAECTRAHRFMRDAQETVKTPSTHVDQHCALMDPIIPAWDVMHPQPTCHCTSTLSSCCYIRLSTSILFSLLITCEAHTCYDKEERMNQLYNTC
jgi:hypothetical protein